MGRKREEYSKPKICLKPELNMSKYNKTEEGSFILKENGRPIARVDFKNKISESDGGHMDLTIVPMTSENNEIIRVVGSNVKQGSTKRCRYFLNCIGRVKVEEEYRQLQSEIKKYLKHI